MAPLCEIEYLNEIFLKYFGYIENGFFVDVGAYDGYNYSNTYGLAEAGWGGICYEPVDEFYLKCVENHKNHNKVKVIKTCVGNKIGTVDFYVHPGAQSTYSEYQYNTKIWKHEYVRAYKTTSDIITLDESLTRNNVKPNFELLGLDVEGSETDVLNFFNINYWKPKMAIVEAQERREAELSIQAPFINKYFEDAGYDKIYVDMLNNIYIRREE